MYLNSGKIPNKLLGLGLALTYDVFKFLSNYRERGIRPSLALTYDVFKYLLEVLLMTILFEFSFNI